MSFQQGLSGLNGSAKQLDVIGNNIANSGTVGFKQSQVQFADLYANSLNGAAGNQAGVGVAVSQIAQQFTKGNIEATTNPLDMAIEGAGFFRTEKDGQVQYTRNGQFQLDKTGSVINAQRAQLTGYPADSNGKILAGAPVPLQIDPGDMKPNATTLVKTQVNFNSNSSQPVKAPFDATDSDTYNKQIPVDVFDTLGNSHVMSSFYVKTGTNSWDVYVALDGLETASAKVAAAAYDASTPLGTAAIAKRAEYQTAVTTVPQVAASVVAAAKAYATAVGDAMLAAAGSTGANATQTQLDNISNAYKTDSAIEENGNSTPDQIDAAIAAAVNVPAQRIGALVFNENGALDKAAMLTANAGLASTTLPFPVSLALFPDTGARKPLSFDFDLTGSTRTYGATTEKKTSQDGYSGGALSTFSTDSHGVIVGQYSNGRTRQLGQVVLANFTDPNGLQPLGSNAWAETSTSGVPLLGEPGTGQLGGLRASSVENSNVDLTAELVNMITAQRSYQANAQTIKTQDQVLQTLLNLR